MENIWFNWFCLKNLIIFFRALFPEVERSKRGFKLFNNVDAKSFYYFLKFNTKQGIKYLSVLFCGNFLISTNNHRFSLIN